VTLRLNTSWEGKFPQLESPPAEKDHGIQLEELKSRKSDKPKHVVRKIKSVYDRRIQVCCS
jgi:hypothetical protein